MTFTSPIVPLEIFGFVAISMAGFRLAVRGAVRSGFEDSGVDALNGSFPPDIGFVQFTNRDHFPVEIGVRLFGGLVLRGVLECGADFFEVLERSALCTLALAANSPGGMLSLLAMVVFAAVGLLTNSGIAALWQDRMCEKKPFAIATDSDLSSESVQVFFWQHLNRLISRRQLAFLLFVVLFTPEEENIARIFDRFFSC